MALSRPRGREEHFRLRKIMLTVNNLIRERTSSLLFQKLTNTQID